MAVCLDYQAVYNRTKVKRNPLRLHLVCALVLFAAFATRIWVRIERTRLGYDLAREQERSIDFDMERRELELSRSVLMRGDNLSRVADKRLGLKPLVVGQVRRLSSIGQ